MNDKSIKLIQETWQKAIKECGGSLKFGKLFYQNIFTAAPEALQMFSFKNEVNMYESEKFKSHAFKVISTIGDAVKGLDDLAALVPVLRELGKNHYEKYGVVQAHYKIVMDNGLLRTLESVLKDDYTQEVKQQWVTLAQVITDTMTEELNQGSKDADRWYNYIFGSNQDLVNLSNFEKERRDGGAKQTLRYVLIAILLWVNLQAFYAGQPLSHYAKYFTWWTVQLQIYSIWLSVSAVNDKDFEKKPAQMAKHHLLYSMTLIMNIITVSIYWPLLHHYCLERYAGDQLRIFAGCYVNHSVPAIVCLVHTFMSNCVLSINLVKLIVVGGMVYSIINCCQTLYLGIPVYEFWTWEDVTSVYIALAMNATFSGVYVLLVKMDECIKYKCMQKVKAD